MGVLDAKQQDGTDTSAGQFLYKACLRPAYKKATDEINKRKDWDFVRDLPI